MRLLSDHAERIFFTKIATHRGTQPKLHLMFCALFLKIALSAEELMLFGYLGDMTPLDYYAYKPETMDALKNNIREAIVEIEHNRLCA